jgi:hypothetical protein
MKKIKDNPQNGRKYSQIIYLIKKKKSCINMVGHASNPSYSGGWRLSHGSRPAQAKSYRDCLAINKLDVVFMSIIPGIWEA